MTDMQTKKFIQSSVLFGSNHYLFYEIFCANQLRGPKAYHDGHKDMFIGIHSCTFIEKTFFILQDFLFNGQSDIVALRTSSAIYMFAVPWTPLKNCENFMFCKPGIKQGQSAHWR